jgi:hypothetical protein
MIRLDKNELKNIDVHSLPDILSVSLWVLEYLSDDKKQDFGASEIADYIVSTLGISTSRQSVHLALSKATSKNYCHKIKTRFKIMKFGQDELLKRVQQERVIFIQPGKPFLAGIKLAEILSSLKKTLKISDSYVDIKTLDVLYQSVKPDVPIKLLTVQINNEETFKRETKKMILEGFDIEVRKISSGVLHDRYLIDDLHFWLSGNSLNNLGKKESFIVMLENDVRESMLRTFDSRWAEAIPV